MKALVKIQPHYILHCEQSAIILHLFVFVLLIHGGFISLHHWCGYNGV